MTSKVLLKRLVFGGYGSAKGTKSPSPAMAGEVPAGRWGHVLRLEPAPSVCLRHPPPP